MGGPIIRSGPTPAFWENWDSVFGGKKGAAKRTAAAAGSAKKSAKPAKSAKAKAAKPKKKK